MARKPTILFVAIIPSDYSPYMAASYGMQRTFDLLPHKHSVLSLVAWLRDNGCDGHYVWIDKPDEVGFSVIEKAIDLCEPDAFGFSLVTEEMMSHYEVIKGLKERYPKIPVIIGGPHVSALPVHTLENFPRIDIVAIGEGERTLTEILVRLRAGQEIFELGDIPGVCLRDLKGEISKGPPRDGIKDINILPDPAYDLIFDTDSPPDERSAYPLVCSYGCYFHCTFCSVEHGNYRNLTPVRVADRMERAVRKYGVEYFAIRDSFWPPTREWLDKFCDEIEKRKMNVKFHFQTRAGTLTEKHNLRLKKLGAQAIAIGVEAGNPEILKAIRKGISIRQARETVESLNSAGIFSIAFFIFGNQGENLSTIQESIDLSLELNASVSFYHVLYPLPGAVAYDFVPRPDKEWWMGKAPLPSICEVPVQQLERLATEAFIKYPLRWEWLKQHVLSGRMSAEFRSIARRIYFVHLRKYLLGTAERFGPFRGAIRGVKSAVRR